MSQFLLTSESTADMTKDFFSERSIPFVRYQVMIDGKTYVDDLGETLPFDQYYKMIADGAMPTTSQVNAETYTAFFEPFLQDGQDILHIAFSSGLSGAYNSACIARDELLQKYPDRKLLIVDSLGASSGFGLFLTLVADHRDAEEPIDTVYNWALDNRLTIHHWFFSTDLTHYKRGGRITAAAAAVGTLFNICPLMNMDAGGHLTPRTKYQGKKRVIKEIVERMKEFAVGGTDYCGKCYISESACYDDARKVADLVEELFPRLNGKVLINSVGVLIGAHTGPGTVALFFVGSKRED